MDRFVLRFASPEQEAQRLMRLVASPGPDMFLDDIHRSSEGFANPLDWAQSARVALGPWACSGKPLRVLLLCAGIDAPGHALQQMGIPVEAEIWDTDSALRPGLLKLHRSSEGLHVGPVSGDILRRSPASFGSANILVAGPPCPPWSSMGVRQSFDDERAEVFVKVLDVIVNQAERGFSSLSAPAEADNASNIFFVFLLENVEGMLKRSREDRAMGRPCPMEQVQEILKERLPPWWVIDILRVETSSAGLPQKRGRVYLRGLDRRHLFDESVRSSDIQAMLAPKLLPHSGLSSLLRLDLPSTDKAKAGRGNKYMANLALYKMSHVRDMQDATKAGMVAVVDLSRDITCRYGANARFDDKSVCLTASNTALWVFSLGIAPASLSAEDMAGLELPIDRWLHPCERALLQGFPADTRLRVRDAVRVFGNAMSVPCVGLLLCPVMQRMMLWFLP